MLEYTNNLWDNKPTFNNVSENNFCIFVLVKMSKDAPNNTPYNNKNVKKIIASYGKCDIFICWSINSRINK